MEEEVDEVVEGEGSHESEQSEDDEETKRTEIRKELSNLTFEELEALKAKMGIKLYNEAMFGKPGSQSGSKKKKQQAFKRDNKNRPRELSSRVRVDKVRKVVHVPTKRVRDPRFENLCGELDEKIWNTNYSFLTDLAKEEEGTLKEKLKSDEVDEEEKLRIRAHIQKMSNKARSNAQKEKLEEKRKQEKVENIQRMKEGKKPYYMKKSTRKFLDLKEKYDELKSSGKLESYLRKKRKKNAVRDKKSVKS
jgi:ribosomal RNA-processing protein 36